MAFTRPAVFEGRRVEQIVPDLERVTKDIYRILNLLDTSPSTSGSGGSGMLPIRAANPTLTELGNSAALYVKNQKLVLAYAAANVRYFATLDLNGSDTTFAVSTTEP